VLDAAVDDAGVSDTAGTGSSPEREQFLCELLASLYVVRADLEGATGRDTAAAIQMLLPVAGALAEANEVWKSLIVLASEQNPLGGHVVEATVRQALPHHKLSPGQRHATALARLAQLEANLRTQTRTRLAQPVAGSAAAPAPLWLPRSEALEALTAAIYDDDARDLLVTGVPSVGKSALAVAAIDRLRERGGHVIALHAAAMARLGTVTDPLEGKLADILANAGSGRRSILIVDGAESGLDQLRHLTAAARHAGYRCVIVSRGEGIASTRSPLTRSTRSSPTSRAWRRWRSAPAP
jgi:hypothetical protein